ncbi:MAG: hypothetical protein ACPGED_09840, partial [Flavobacteriales bacterium]
MRNINDLEQEDLLYLKNKWSAEIQDFEDQIEKTERRLSGRLHRNDDSTEGLEALEQRLANATGILESIQVNPSIDPLLVQNQEQEVIALQEEYDDKLSSSTKITGREVQQAIMDMDNLQVTAQPKSPLQLAMAMHQWQAHILTQSTPSMNLHL